MSFQEGTEKVRVSAGAVLFYENYTTTNLYVEKTFDAYVNTLVVANDSATDTVSVSFNGATLHGEALPKESMDLNVADKTSVYVKGTAGGGNVRIWGY